MKKLLLTSCILAITFASCYKENKNLSQARKHLKQKEYEEAIAFYEEAIKNNENITNTKQEITETLYQLGKTYYQKENYQKSISTLKKLISAYPNNPYKKKANDTIKNAYSKNIIKLNNNKKLHECLTQINEYKKSYNMTDTIQKIETKTKYNIALNHYNKQEYFLAHRYIKEIRTHSKPIINKIKKLEEQILFHDGKNQFLIKAYPNARKIFKELLVLYPKSQYKKQTEIFLKQINYLTENDNYSNSKKNKNIIEKLEEKAYEKNDPYTKRNIITIIKYFYEEKEKNEENLKQNIFPIYKDKYIKLNNITIQKYTKNKSIGILDPKTRSKLDGILNWQSKNQLANYKYILHLKTIPNLFVLLQEKDFLKLNFKKPIKPIKITASIFDIKIENKKIKIFTIPLTLKQK